MKLFFKPTWEIFIGTVTLCGYASFLFGWHVHEKAILLVIIPFSLLALKDRRFLGAFRPLAVAGHVSLFPLLFTAAEFPVKTLYTIFWLILFLLVFDRLAPCPLNLGSSCWIDSPYSTLRFPSHSSSTVLYFTSSSLGKSMSSSR